MRKLRVDDDDGIHLMIMMMVVVVVVVCALPGRSRGAADPGDIISFLL